jgi:hypothetical protein
LTFCPNFEQKQIKNEKSEKPLTSESGQQRPKTQVRKEEGDKKKRNCA